MSAPVVKLKPLPALPDDLPGVLRQLADDVESGRVTAMVVAYVQDDEYEFLWPSSRHESIILTALAHSSAVEGMRK